MENKMLNKQRLSIVKKNYMNKEWLIQKYINEKLTMQELSKQAKCCYVTIWIWMNKFKIKRRNHSESYKLPKVRHIKLKESQIEVIKGLLLGDGSLTLGLAKRSACYEHGDKHLKFIEWLNKKFNLMGFISSGKIYFMKHIKNGAYKFKTVYYSELGDLYKEFYYLGLKRIPFGLKITPTILKYWYIGDGNFSKAPLIDSTIFSIEDLKRISKQLSYLSIKNTLREFKDRKRIRISKKSETAFFNYILSEESEIPPSYKYKFPKELIC